MLVDEGDHDLNRRSSSAWAKNADAFQNLVGLAQLVVLALQLFDPLRLSRGRAGPHPRVELRLPHPAPQRLGRSRSSARSTRPPPTAMGIRRGAPAPCVPRAHGLPGKTCSSSSSVHGSILSRVGASGNPGAIHINQKRYLGVHRPYQNAHRKARESLISKHCLSPTPNPAGTLFRCPSAQFVSARSPPASRRGPDGLSGHGIPGSWARSRYGNGNR